MKKTSILFLVLGITLHFVILLSLKFTAWPEMFSFPYLYNSGFSLYSDFAHVYPPLLTILLSKIYMIFGYEVIVLQVVTWLLIMMTDIVLFFYILSITKNKWSALIGVIFYAIVQSILEGNMMWFDNALVLPVLLSFIFAQNKRWFYSGFFIAIALLIKQTALIYLLLLLVYIFFNKVPRKKTISFVLPIIISAVVFLIFFSKDFTHFINWCFYYPLNYWRDFPGYLDFSLTRNEILTLSLLYLPLLFVSFKKDNLIKLFAISALIAVYPRFSFFHLQPAIPLISILFAIMFDKFKLISIVYFFVVIYFSIMPRMVWEKGDEIRFFDQGSISDVNFINEFTNNGSRIYLLGLPSHYYLLTNTYPTKPWIDNYGWYFAAPGFDAMAYEQWKANPPEYVFLKKASEGNWYDLSVYRIPVLVNLAADLGYKQIGEKNDISVWKINN